MEAAISVTVVAHLNILLWVVASARVGRLLAGHLATRTDHALMSRLSSEVACPCILIVHYCSGSHLFVFEYHLRQHATALKQVDRVDVCRLVAAKWVLFGHLADVVDYSFLGVRLVGVDRAAPVSGARSIVFPTSWLLLEKCELVVSHSKHHQNPKFKLYLL